MRGVSLRLQQPRHYNAAYAIDLLEILLVIFLSWLFHKIFDEILHQRHTIWKRAIEPLLNKIRKRGEVLGIIGILVFPLCLCIWLFYFTIPSLLNESSIYTFIAGFLALLISSFGILSFLDKLGFLEDESKKAAVAVYGTGIFFPILYAFLIEEHILGKLIPRRAYDLHKFCIWESYYYDYNYKIDLVAVSGFHNLPMRSFKLGNVTYKEI